ncbi:MAG: hypothetical protein HND58_09065 [Planctomycetota bacterium]|nr:MAG: hypothetical protein HND58_09065 [Planctomycetota bacterium]
MLGPLCVGFSAFRVEDWTPDEGAPDLWKLLDKAVCRKGRDSRGRIAVADSKKLKLSNQSKTRHPLTHLERGVLAFGGLLGGGSETGEPRSGEPVGASGGAEVPGQDLTTDELLFGALGVHLESHPLVCAGRRRRCRWRARRRRTRSRGTCWRWRARGRVWSRWALACIAVGESEFNEAVRTGGSKAHLTTRCFARYLRRVVERWGDGSDEVRVVCDRHGGRTSYASMIGTAVRGLGCGVETLEETERCSRYVISGGASPEEQGVHVQFRPEAEEAHLPVALASMTAKMVRELSMARFNRYWCARMPELKPTAGYVQDARRWLEDLDGVMYDDEREAMVRQA